MHLAIISDIHGECFALDRVLQDIRRQGVEQIVCLGDALQGGSQPAEIVARLRELNYPVVMGNADAWLITGQGEWLWYPSSDELTSLPPCVVTANEDQQRDGLLLAYGLTEVCSSQRMEHRFLQLLRSA